MYHPDVSPLLRLVTGSVWQLSAGTGAHLQTDAELLVVEAMKTGSSGACSYCLRAGRAARCQGQCSDGGRHRGCCAGFSAV